MSSNDETGRASARSSGDEGGRKPALPDATGESPGVPGFRTWRGVYLFVFGCFAALVLALTVFTRVFG